MYFNLFYDVGKPFEDGQVKCLIERTMRYGAVIQMYQIRISGLEQFDVFKY
jgi:hypothetical protein